MDDLSHLLRMQLRDSRDGVQNPFCFAAFRNEAIPTSG